MSVICYCATGVMDLSGVFCVADSGVIQDAFLWNSMGMHTCSVWFSNNMLGVRDPTPPNSDSDTGSAGSDKSNRYAVLQDNDEEEVSNATTDVLPIEEIPELIQEGAVLIQPDSNETPDNSQVEVAEPVVERGTTPQEEDPQPDGIVSSKDADFIKAKSE